MGSPRLECLKCIYNRPTLADAVGEVVLDYIKHGNPNTPIESIVANVRKDMAKAKSTGTVL